MSLPELKEHLNNLLLVRKYRWRLHARPNQLPPEGDWDYWLILAGRGFGKTRTGAEWVIEKAHEFPGCRIAGIAPTAADARDTMVEGESGIIACSPPWDLPVYESSKRRLTWKNGSRLFLFSAEEPDRLRGPQHHYCWMDELCAWKYPDTYDMAMFGLRLGDHPQACITTTPRPIKLLKELIKDPQTIITKGSTYENKQNLAPSFLSKIVKKYEGTRLGRQELNAEILDDVEGALWTRDLIERSRVKHTQVPDLCRLLIGVDPAVTSNEETSAETGIIAAGLGIDGIGYVLDDYSLLGTPTEWASRSVDAYKRYQADAVVAEINNGGELVETVLRVIDPMVSYWPVHASRGKQTRAQPMSSLYEKGWVKHVGAFPQLEDQMCEWIPGEKSPDRLDALVWVLTKLMLDGPVPDDVIVYEEEYEISPI